MFIFCNRIDVDEMLVRTFELFKGRWRSILAVLLHVDDPEQRVKWMKHVGLPTSAKDCQKRPEEAKMDLWVLWAAVYLPELYKAYREDWDRRKGPKGAWPPSELTEVTRLICEVYRLWPKGKLTKVNHPKTTGIAPLIERTRARQAWINHTIKKCDDDLRVLPGQASETRALFNSLKLMLWP